ncbi:alcohol dehydrogenase catalytic domain-containing protein [Wenyingzhuangia sp. 2_MG-2023]|uniref:alcohol dehydrogenase catalytic domain-containing protein n=1 Tax=Wenyingzhuangia sp. 2_MG-2023 TaxID=3062639 RepID=UPI0026E240F8|nr:alcohol dehydrogenase catalytic domain-containing protein [Wenyingzhuangia sp. 2_MG-2023]MDO6736573.1 alcohol dehydrogenase catalytic domain-containing protein [Wenyingzhuangia sp. 2_MG-2023]
MSVIECKAAISIGDGKFTIENIKVNQPKGDEVLVKMMASGLCHTDHDSLTWGMPIVLGHEGAGIVTAVGEAVENVKVGDEVILNWATPCYSCFQCQEGNQHICENNSPVIANHAGKLPGGHVAIEGTTWNGEPIERSFNIGTLSEYTLVRSSAVVKKQSKKLSFESASIVCCGVMTGCGSVFNTAKVTFGSSVVVLGTGGVGLNVIQAARISGAAKIIAIDINENRLKMAQEFGATDVILADKKDKGLMQAAEIVKTMTEGRGADFAFECTAVPALGVAPLAMIRNAGTAVQVSGIEEEITVDMRLFEWDKKYINPLYGAARPEIDFPKLEALYDKGDLMLDEMITNTYTLDNLEQAFADMLSGKNAKGVITFKN